MQVPLDDSGLTDEKPALPGGAGGGGAGAGMKGLNFDLEEDPSIEKLGHSVNRLACDRVEIAAVRLLQAVVAGVDVDKSHYYPDETVKAVAHLAGAIDGSGGTYKLVADDIVEADTARRVFSKEVTLGPGQKVDVAFEYPLAEGKVPATEFGHQIRCALLKDEKEVHDASEVFGVSANVYRIGIYCNDASGQDKSIVTRESVRAGMEENKKNYGNWFEQFAWAPCTFSNMTPKTEDWYSGQAQYHGTKTGFRIMIEEAHRVGIKALTYGHQGGGGIAALENYQRHPEIFASGYDGSGLYNSFLMDRAYFNEYDFSDVPDVTGKGKWHYWNCIWMGSGSSAFDWGVNELIGSTEMFGWDGVRWDAAIGPAAEIRKRLLAKYPRYVFGYNILQANAKIYLPPARDTAEFHESARDHGMMMDETVRNYWTGSAVRDFYQAMGLEGDYIKRIGGVPLIIPFGGTNQDNTFITLSALAAGERNYAMLGGGYPYGPLARFVTRYSAFIWDDTARIADTGSVVQVKVGRGPKGAAPWHDYTTWLRKLPNGHQQVLVNLINPPHYAQYSDRVQPPPSTLNDVALTVPTPAGAKLVRAMHISPDMREGLVDLEAKIDGASGTVTLPRLRLWSIVALEYAPADGKGELAYPAFKLTTPLEDAKAYMANEEKEKLAKKQAEQRTEAGLEKAAATQKGVHFSQDFKNSYNVDAAAGKALVMPDDLSVRRNGTLDVLHCHGLFAWLDPVENAMGLIGGGRYATAWSSNEGLEGPPRGLAGLLPYDAIVLDNVHASALGHAGRAMINEYVKAGGGLVVFAGMDNLSMGMDRNTALDELLPVTIVSRENTVRDDKGLPFAPAKEGFFPAATKWAKAPKVFCLDASPLKQGVEVLAKAGDRPVIVSHRVGKGRVVVLLMEPIGNYAEGLLPYWKWSDWPRVIGACLQYAAGDFKSVDPPKVLARKLDPKEQDPASLLIEAAMISDPAAFTKKLKSAQKNLVDASTARAIMTAALDNADKVDDQNVFEEIGDAAGPFLDASFAPLATKLVTSQHLPLRRAGYQVLGLAGDQASRPRLEVALERERDRKSHREILIAIGRLKSSESIPAVRRYFEKGSEQLLALGVLKRLGDPDTITEGANLYARSTRQLLGNYGSYIAQWWAFSRFAGRMTPGKRREALAVINATEGMMERLSFDTRYFADSLSPLSDAEVAAMTEFLRTTESRTGATLAYVTCGHLTEARAEAFRRGLADAKQAQLRTMSE
ncbi:MAG: glutamine amidotransferase [Planctomycetota bacterium]|nr:glutamine amidotransferase [Planctomycetota bacterium]